MGIVGIVEVRVRSELEGEHTGHDWHHTDRVRRLALTIARAEGADPEIVELAAILHDVDDFKFSGDEHAAARYARRTLAELGYDAERAEHVASIVDTLSFKGANVDDAMASVEGRCVQDADRLDALGAIGIARCFAYGGHKGRPIYEPGERTQHHGSIDAYRMSTSSGVGHFYEKLLLLKDRMKTPTGRRLAQDRHAFMERYLERFFAEWDAER